MTLAELNGHLDMVTQLHSAREDLQTLQDRILGAQQYDGMPHAPGAGDKVGALAVKLAELEEVVHSYERQKAVSEKTVKAFIDSITDNRTNLIFYLRFICGYDWQGVAEVIGGRNTVDAVKSQCYRYLQSTGDA